MEIAGIGGNNSSRAANFGGTGSEVSEIQKELQTRRRELSELEKKQELSREEQAEKQELKQRIAELEQQLQKAREAQREEKNQKNSNVPLKENGKGEKVDKLI